MAPASRGSGGLILAVTLALSGGAASGCGDDDGARDRSPVGVCVHLVDAGPEAGIEAGIAMGCPERQMCNTSSTEARCICVEGYAGSGCTTCERGWRSVDLPDGGVDCDPIPVDCDRDPFICEPGGECETYRGASHCNCHRGYTGRVCSRCDHGFQDNDGDGSCEPSCRGAGLSCPGRRECSDASGEAECVCIEGYSGTSCDSCAPGYRQTGVGGCLPTCEVADLDCGTHGACSDIDGVPRCVCDVGYEGEDCATCAETHRDDGMGVCIGDPPEGYTLLATARGERGEPVIGAISTADRSFVPLVMLDRDVTGIAYDDTADRLFGVASGTLVEIDRLYGTTTEIPSTTGATLQSGLAFDPSRGVLYAVESGSSLVSIDPSTGEVRTLGWAGGSSGWGASLAYDPSTDRILGAHASSTSRFEIDPDTGVATTLAPLGIDHPFERLAIAAEPSASSAWAVLDATRTPSEQLESACRETAAALGYAIPDSEAIGGWGTTDPEMPDAPIVFDYAESDPPLLMYGSYGDRSAAPRVVRVDTRHPDAVVCIGTYEEPLHVVVTAEAQLHFLILASYEPNLSLQIEEGFTPKLDGVPPVRVRVVGSPVDPSLLGPPDQVRFYDGPTWSALGVTSELWSSSSAEVTPSLVAIQWESGAVFERPIDVRSFSGGLTALGGTP